MNTAFCFLTSIILKSKVKKPYLYSSFFKRNFFVYTTLCFSSIVFNLLSIKSLSISFLMINYTKQWSRTIVYKLPFKVLKTSWIIKIAIHFLTNFYDYWYYKYWLGLNVVSSVIILLSHKVAWWVMIPTSPLPIFLK